MCERRQLNQQNLQTMQNLYERRQAKFDYYRQQYEQSPHDANRVLGHGCSDVGEDEIDHV